MDKNSPKQENLCTTYICRNTHQTLEHDPGIMPQSQEVLIEPILPFPKIGVTEICAIFRCLYWHYPRRYSCYCQSRYYYKTFVRLQCHQTAFQKNK